jgi:hypothetical protein
MTDRLEAALAPLIADIEDIDDPEGAFKAIVATEAGFSDVMRRARQRLAVRLRDRGMTYREIGAVMGKVTAQRAEQVAKGR